MRVYLSNYRDHWLSPYTILEKVFFWREIDYDEPIIDRLSNILNPFCIAWQKFLDFVHPRINYVKIDRWDTWSMDSTLAHIILPMLKQLRDTKHGAPLVEDEDVPDELKSTSAPPKENEYDVDDNHFKRWDWVLDEMIFAFEHLVDDSWQDAYSSGEFDIIHIPVDADGNEVPKAEAKLFKMGHGPNHTYKCDYEGIAKVEMRMQNGFRLFGRYYRNLWD
ncbi:MAG: hypothetical protein EBU90_21685 [Proteobacteria bacterium]|nr:hypothetical protein [Pseudomonadota bacterium]